MSIDIMAEIKSGKQEAMDWLLLYHQRRVEYEGAKSSILNSSKPPDCTSVHAGVGNPTMQKAMQITDLLHYEEWMKVIEFVELKSKRKKKIFLQVRREAVLLEDESVRGRPAWVVYVQQHYAEEMAKEFGGKPENYWVAETTLKEWWQKLIVFTMIVAMKKKLI